MAYIIVRFHFCAYRLLTQQFGKLVFVEFPVIASQCSHWRGNLHRIPGSRTSYAVGALIERPAEKFLIFRFLSAKRFHLTGIFAKTHRTTPSGTQRRNDYATTFVTTWARALPGGRSGWAPLRGMTKSSLEFDGDSHESSEHWFGMTPLFDAQGSSSNSNMFTSENHHL